MESLRIRPAIAGDAVALARLLGQLGYPTDSDEIPGRLERLEARPGTTAFVAETDDGVVGAFTIHLFSSLHTSEPVAWLTAVVVEENARGQGVGAAMVKHAEEWAARHGANRVSLTSALRRTRAHKFYQDLSYEHTGVRLTKVLNGAQPRAQPASSDDEFSVVEFEHHDEAASFVAALSRLLQSPSLASRRDANVEVWARSPVASESVRLFLSQDAMAAARSGFSPIPVARTVTRHSLPDESFLIIEAGVTPAWGAAEASAKLLTR